MAKRIVIATPHTHGDVIDPEVQKRLPAYSVVRIREHSALTAESLARLQPEWVFFPHWSWIIPEEIHHQYRCVIFHMTDVPYGRGGSPLQNLVIRGHKTTMLSAIACVAELDAGPVYLRKPLSLDGTAEAILQRATQQMIGMIGEIVTTSPEPIPQSGEQRIRETETGTVFAHHYGDVSVDHRLAHEAVLAATRPQPGCSLKELYFFEVPSSSEWRPAHSASPFVPGLFVDITDTLAMKLDALMAYRDELREFRHPRSMIGVESLARWRGATAGMAAAEAFEVGRIIR